MIFEENTLVPCHFAVYAPLRKTVHPGFDELLKLGVNSGKRCPMQTEKTVAVDGKESESNRGQPVAWWEHRVTTQSVLS